LKSTCRGERDGSLSEGVSRGRFALVCAATAACTAAAQAQTDQRLLFDDWREGERVELAAEARLYQSAGFSKSGTHARLDTYSSKGRVRLSTQHDLNPSLGYDMYVLTSRNTGGLLPRTLSDSSVAFATPLGNVGEWFVAASAGAGYAGDAAFGNSKAWYGKGELSIGRELAKDEHLLIWLEYDGNRLLLPDVPTPSIAYSNDTHETFSYVLGIPDSSFEWKPTAQVTARAEWSLPMTLDASVDLMLTDALSIFGQYRNSTRSFHTEALSRSRRVFFDEQTIETGLHGHVASTVTLTAAAGYAFSRSFKTGFDDRNLTTLSDVGDAPYLRFELRVAF